MKYLPNPNKCYDVYVDGKKASHVLEADTEEGYVICAKFPFEIDDESFTVKTYTLHGNITIEEIKEKQE